MNKENEIRRSKILYNLWIKRILCIIVSFILFFIYLYIQRLIGGGVDYFLGEEKAENYLTEVFFLATLASVIYSSILYIIIKRNNKTEQNKNKFKISSIIIAFIGGIACFELTNVIAVIIGIIFPSWLEAFNNDINSAVNGNILLSAITISVLAPIGEELLFRGVIFSKLRKYNHFVIAIILQAVMFGIFHMNPFQGIYVIPLGLMTAFVVYEYNSVIPAIILHAVNNMISYIITYGFVGNAVVQQIVALIVLALSICCWVFLVLYFCLRKSK